MSLTAAAIRRDRVTMVLVVVLLLSGIGTYESMAKKMDPGFIVRNAQVVTYFPGASPDRVEQLVTDPIERVVQEIPELEFSTSESRTGVSMVVVKVRDEFKQMRPIWDDLRRKVESIRQELPDGIRGPVVNDNLGDTYPVIVGMTGDGFEYRELKEMADIIRDELLRIPSVAKVDVLGAQDERLFVEYDNAQLAQLGLSPASLRELLVSRNIIMPGGQVDVGPETIALEPSGNFASVAELRRTLIPLPRGGVAFLGDFVSIRRGYVDPPRSKIRVSGLPGLAFAVSMADGGNLVDLGVRVQAFFAALPASYPHGIDFHTTFFQPADVEKKVDQFMGSVMQAIGIVLVVMLLTLGLRTGLVVAALIPSAMVISIFVLGLMEDVSINQMTLASLIIALGLLVDNAIVVSESIMVRMGQGEKAFDAAVDACRELQVPLLISSLTTGAAFLPIYLAESNVGEYTGILFVVVTITLLVSWLLALTLTPLLCTWFIRPVATGEQFGGIGYRGYRTALRWVIRFRWLSVLIVVLSFVGTMQLFKLIPNIFFPPKDLPFFMAELSLTPGASMEATEALAREVDGFLERELTAEGGGEGVTGWTTFIGETPPPFTLGYSPKPSDSAYCELMVHTTSAAALPRLMERLHRWAIDRFPDVHANIRPLGNGPPVDKPVQIRISGPDVERVFGLIDGVSRQLATIPGTRGIHDDWGNRVKKFAVSIDDQRARRAGLSNQDVAISLQTFLSGLETTRYRENDKSIPVLLRSRAADRRDLDRLSTLAVFEQRTGRSVPLTQVADVSLRWQPAKVLRRNRYRTVTINASVEDGVTAASVFSRMKPWLEQEAREWPVGYRWEFGGEFESSVKANASIGAKLPIAALSILLLLVWQFNSLRKPAIVLSTIVLGMMGVVLGLLTMKSYFGFMTLLGVISLAGIVINNAIVLLDRIEIEVGAGREQLDAVIVASQQRVRPILLTTATTVASLIPLYVSGGPMWEPMAVAIMFGLVFATILTLLVVPLLYSIAYRA
ncbi:MAG: efflux RND transporter permease subunit [Myxococcales bacterium]|nr:efflux RND transporter permease subunit [Myxococcales bacterium]